jgi:protein TonB
MNRYLSSFALSSVIYVTVVATIFYFINNNNCDANSKIEAPKVVKISLLDIHQESQKQEEQKQVEQKKEVPAPTPKQEVKKELVAKVKPKKILKKAPTPIVKDTKTIEKVAHKEETQQEKANESFSAEEETLSRQILSNAAAVNHENSLRDKQRIMAELESRQESFFLKLRELINQNKSYPNSARRRGVQGNVEVKFSILENGNVDNIELVSGQSIFKNSAQEAIKKSFPIKVDKTLFSFPKEFKITLAYVLISDATN